MNAIRLLIVIGTRPEAIKLAPVVRHLCSRQDEIQPIICFTGQHQTMINQVAEYFELRPDVDLGVMRPNQTLAGLTSITIRQLDETIAHFRPSCVMAQGDTTSVLASSIAAFYRHVPFVHVEAGLRAGSIKSPWPEEFNRRVATLTAALHCAPTHQAAKNLVAEGVDDRTIAVCGNTVVDALQWTLHRERLRAGVWESKHPQLRGARCVLVTTHRRENFGAGIESICRAVSKLARLHSDVQFVCPVHLNPNVQTPIQHILGELPNVYLSQPLAYPEFVWLMDRSLLILTDSGGVQEEAPSLGKPVLILRDSTERPEGVDAGIARLVGTSQRRIIEETSAILAGKVDGFRLECARNPYGDGNAAERIVDRTLSLLDQGEPAFVQGESAMLRAA